MLPAFLIDETVVREEGTGPAVALGPVQGKCIMLTLGITQVVEQESLDVSIWGSADGTSWGNRPLAAFPQKFYCGTYQLLVDLSQHPEIASLRAQWKVSRWGRGDPKPLFGFYLFANMPERVAAAESS